MVSNDFLRCTFLFRGVNNDEISKILEENPPKIISYKRGDKIYSSIDEKLVGFIVSGSCEIRRLKSDGSKTVLNCLGQNGSFGIMSVFSSEEFPTQIFDLKNSEILYFTDSQIKDIVNNNLQISQNLINFLVNRISFLNKKIATFSGTRVEERRAAFLLCQAHEHCSDSFHLNHQKTSEEINAGRASVYRALASLEDAGLISVNQKIISIKDHEGLERITK